MITPGSPVGAPGCVPPWISTPSVIAGSSACGAIVAWPAGSIAKLISSLPTWLFAIWSAARSVHCSPVSSASTSQSVSARSRSSSSEVTLTTIGGAPEISQSVSTSPASSSTTVSVPSPQSIESFPGPPVMTSSPPRATISSGPARPSIVSLLAVGNWNSFASSLPLRRWPAAGGAGPANTTRSSRFSAVIGPERVPSAAPVARSMFQVSAEAFWMSHLSRPAPPSMELVAESSWMPRIASSPDRDRLRRAPGSRVFRDADLIGPISALEGHRDDVRALQSWAPLALHPLVMAPWFWPFVLNTFHTTPVKLLRTTFPST